MEHKAHRGLVLKGRGPGDFSEIMNPQKPFASVALFDRGLNIETGDFSHFVQAYAPERFSADELRQRYSSLYFVVHGYNDDPRELPEIPEVRVFFQRLHKAWPYFAFFAATELANADLFMCMAASECQVVRLTGAKVFSTSIPPVVCEKMILGSLIASEDLFRRVGLHRRIPERIKALMP